MSYPAETYFITTWIQSWSEWCSMYFAPSPAWLTALPGALLSPIGLTNLFPDDLGGALGYKHLLHYIPPLKPGIQWDPRLFTFDPAALNHVLRNPKTTTKSPCNRAGISPVRLAVACSPLRESSTNDKAVSQPLLSQSKTSELSPRSCLRKVSG